MKFKIVLGKVLMRTFGKVLPNKGFRKIRVHWARFISKKIDKKANICKGAVICGDGKNLVIQSHAALGINCEVGSNCKIGKGTMMGPNCIILTQNHKFNYKTQEHYFETNPVIIGSFCWIGTRVVILPGAKIGDHCIVGAGSVVPNKKYPDYCLIAGNPAVVKKILK